MNEAHESRERPFTGFSPSGYRRCPMCRYLLTGLPATHQCPECAFEYDVQTRLWMGRLPNGARNLMLLIGTASLVIFAIALSGYDGRWLPRILWSDEYLPYICLLTAGASLWPIWRHRHSPWMTGVTLKGVFYRGYFGRTRFVGWTEIESIEREVVNGVLRGILTHKNGSCWTISTPISGDVQLRQFIRAVEYRLSRTEAKA